MRLAFAVLLSMLVAACQTTSSFQRASNALHIQDQRVSCWARSDSDKSGISACGVGESYNFDEAECWSGIDESERETPEIAGKRLESCMRERGWTLLPIASLIEVKRAPNCRFVLPIEMCPSTGR